MPIAILSPQPARISQPTVRILDNGVRVIAEQIPVDAVTLQIWLNVGAAVESDDINGMAHFLEHMIFKGSQRQQLGEFERAIESHGGSSNAATSHDYTHYFITVTPKDFAALAPRQIDLVLHASLPHAEFQRERSVVLEEIRRSEDNPDRRVFRHVRELSHRQLPYRRPVLGTEEVIAQLNVDCMRDFHRYWYVPQNMTVAVVGNLPIEEAFAVVAATFATAATPRSPLGNSQRSSWQPEPAFQDIERKVVEDPRLQRARLVMTWRVPGFDRPEESFALSVLSAILSGGRTSRLVKDLRETRGLVDRISAANSPQVWQGTFQIAAHLPTANLAAAEEAIRHHITRIHERAIESAELEKICTQVANRFIFGSESPRERASTYGFYDRVVGNLEAATTYPERIKSLTRDELLQVARKYLNPNAYGVLFATPEATGGV